jgi:nucleoid-associated protein YgaU
LQRIRIASGAAAIVAAAIAGYLIFGKEDPAPPPVADAGTAAPAAGEAAPPPPAPPVQTAETPPPPAAAEAPAEAPAAGQEQPVITVKKREAAPGPTAAVTAPLPESDAAAPAVVAPSFDVVRVERSGETVIAGRAEPDSEVTVKDQKGEALGKARADSSGAWALVTEAPLTPGSHEIGIEAASGEGATQLSEDLVVVVVPEPKAEAAKAEPAAAAAPESQVLAVLTPRQGNAATRVLPQQPEDGIAQGDLVLDSVDYDETGRVIIGGRASPGTRMLIYLDNRLVGDTRAGAAGRWSHSPADPVSEGLHSLRVDQVDESGKVLARVETPFSREAVRVAENDEDFVIVQPGNSLWRIARRAYGEGIRYSVIYQANKDQIRDPDLIYPGQVFELPGTD